MIYCIGDSLTYGYGVPRKFCWVTLLKEHGFQTENHGVSGENTDQILSRLDDLLPKITKEDTILLLTGSNDIFDDNVLPTNKIKNYCKKLQEQNIHFILMTPLPIDEVTIVPMWSDDIDFDLCQIQLKQFRDELLEYAKEENLPIVDLYPLFIENDQPKTSLFYDGIHANREGQIHIVNEILKILK